LFITPCGLLLIALFTSSLSAFWPDFQVRVKPPSFGAFTDFVRLALLCICAAFAEEAVFRVFLPSCFEKAGAVPAAADGFSAALFGCFHVWEGRFGVLNALAAALFLSWCYRRYGSFTALFLSHALYNFLVYLILIFEATN
jgi:membrane protease YdiL (CAAX protease family)